MTYTIYKIYYGNNLTYIGRTNMKLQDRLRGHFFKKSMMREIDINQVSKIEYAELETQADMYLQEVYLINKFKPTLNKDDKAKDNLTIELPELEFKEFYSYLLDKWKNEINLKDFEYKKKTEENHRLAEVFREERKTKFSELPFNEYQDWLDEQKTLINCKLDEEKW